MEQMNTINFFSKKFVRMKAPRVKTRHIINFNITPASQNKKSGWSWPMVSFGLSTLLAVSETLPFFSEYRGNGIIDAIKVASEQLKKI